MLPINSWISTVLPTPAPPNKPTLPPLTIGQIKSITFIPVSRISTVPDWSISGGGSRWIGAVSLKSPFWPSIGWPVTLNMRPSVASPTGTLIGAPVSVTSAPRSNPSVELRAIARTLDSLRCCATSNVNSTSPYLTFRALNMAGKLSVLNCTSTTTPTIWVILPFLAKVCLILAIQGLRTTCYFCKLLRDCSLPGRIKLQSVIINQIVGVVGGVFGGQHAHGVLAGLAFQHRLPDLSFNQTGRDLFHHRFHIRLKVTGYRHRLISCRHRRRQKLLFYGHLGNRRFELGEDDADFVDRFIAVVLHQSVKQRPHVVGGRMVAERRIDRQQFHTSQTPHELRAFTADGNDMASDFLAL